MLSFSVSILLSVVWFLVMRAFRTFKVNTLQAVVVNYWVCVATGLLFLEHQVTDKTQLFTISWNKYAFLLGLSFVGTFYLVALTAKNVSVTLATIASKASMVIPVVVNLWVLQTTQKLFDFWNYCGVVLALVSVLLSSIKSEDQQNKKMSQTTFLLPLLVFFLNGLCDTGTNVLNYYFVKQGQEALFSILTFGSAGIGGLAMLIYSIMFQKQYFEAKSLWAGIALGVPNFFSFYFLLKALTAFNNDGALVFPIFNICIILLSALLAVVIFRENLSKLNYLGIFLSVLAIFLLAYQEIFAIH
ncbi:MAG: hypothetical protein NZ551_03030 [Microscillaceae bacterium]|nr:hypothetical protein [Microscillaceae bacterium]MDW8460162.1 hypothetical protein [Cytophagales bacterium]